MEIKSILNIPGGGVRHSSDNNRRRDGEMVSELSEEELFIIEYLCRNRKFKPDRSLDSEHLKNHFKYKFSSGFKTAIKKLKNLGYIIEVKKKPVRYYAILKYALPALKAQGIDVPMGKQRRL